MSKKKKSKKWWDKKSFHVELPLFKVDVLFMCNLTEKEIPVHLKKFCGKKNFKSFKPKMIKGWDKRTAQGRMIKFMGGHIILIKSTSGNFKEFVSIMVHEITHASHYLLRDRRVPLNEDTEEIYCYLTEYMTEQALIKLYD